MPGPRKKASPSESSRRSMKRTDGGIPRDDRPSDEEIRARAYELYLERGGMGGNEVEDWLRAETELRKPRTLDDALP